jgi:polar amino acid transport system permease protein
MIDHLTRLAEGIVTTLQITGGAFVLGCAGGLVLVLARRSRWPVVCATATGYVELVRGVPPVAWLFVIYYGLAQGGYLTLGPVASGVVGFALMASAYLGEIFRAAVESVPRGQWDAAAASGLGQMDTQVRVVLPQAVLVALPAAAGYGIGLLKDTSIVAVIGAADITFQATELTRETFDGFGVFLLAGLLYVALGLPVAAASRWLDARLARVRFGS